MADYTYASEIVLGELLRISSGVIWKNPKKALAGESLDDSIMVEQYNLARQGRLTFDMIYTFNESVLMDCGMSEEDAERGADDPSYIPESIRPMVAEKQQAYTLETYDEPNNYYRMLNGLPDKEDTDYFYNTQYPEVSDSDTPIHELDMYQLYELERLGYLEALINENPDKLYLKHLTSKKIDPYLARNTEDYGLLWLPVSNYSSLVEEFKSTYNMCRYMVTTVYTIKSLSKENTEYPGFIGLIILFATINQMHRKFLDADITRDFYDEDSLRYIYDSYGVPFYASIPIEYHKNIVKNINRLISQKGSTQVIFTLFDIFGLSDMSIFEYYMMKIHKFDKGKPVFAKDKDGNPDYKKMYDIKFAKVKLYNDPVSEISDFQNHVEYRDLTETDPYWISDKELMDTLYTEEYNYVESKYLGLQTTFNLMKIIYESSYYIKMIIDNREYLTMTEVYNNNIGENCNLFDLVIYICALLCRKFGFEGNIPSDPHAIGKVMGFNFKDDLLVLKKNISENDYLKNDGKLLELLENMNVNSLESIYTVYTRLTSLRSYLTNKMWETDQPEVYWAYYELYNTIMYSEYVDGVFKKNNGTSADSFADLLSDINHSLFYRFDNPGLYDENSEVSDMLYLLKNSCSALSQIQYVDDVNIDKLIEYLFKLVEFFKSAKADLTGYTIVFSLISNSENIMKMMNYIDSIVDNHLPIYSIVDELKDIITFYRDLMKFEDDLLVLVDQLALEMNKTIVWSQIDRLEDYMTTISVLIRDTMSELNLNEEIHAIESTYLPLEGFLFEDNVTLLYDDVQEILRFFIMDEFHIKDILYSMQERIHLIDQSTFSFSEEVITFFSFILAPDHIQYKDEFTDDFSLIWGKSELIWNDVMKSIFKHRLKDEPMSFEDILINLKNQSFLPDNNGEIVMKDDIPESVSIYLNADMGENWISYLDILRNFFYQYYVDEFVVLQDKITASETTYPDFSELTRLDTDVLGMDTESKLKSGFTMTDMLILRNEYVEED